jgi:septal ring factor EnvC (AmiA/AmiB activator)
MPTEVHEFDIHIIYTHSNYDGDSKTDCTVTYPPARKDQQPFIREYSDYCGDLSQSQVAANAAKDIAEYMRDPEGTLEEWIKKSGSDWENLRELQHELQDAQKRAESACKNMLTYQEGAQKYEKQIAELEARLKGARHE